MRSDDMAGDAKRRVPIQKKKEEINIMDIIDFHTHPYLTQEENACMYREGFSLEPEEAKEDLLGRHRAHMRVCHPAPQ